MNEDRQRQLENAAKHRGSIERDNEALRSLVETREEQLENYREIVDEEIRGLKAERDALLEKVDAVELKLKEQEEVSLRFRRQRDAARSALQNIERGGRGDLSKPLRDETPSPSLAELRIERGILTRERFELVQTVGRLRESNERLLARVRELEATIDPLFDAAKKGPGHVIE